MFSIEFRLSLLQRNLLLLLDAHCAVLIEDLLLGAAAAETHQVGSAFAQIWLQEAVLDWIEEFHSLAKTSLFIISADFKGEFLWRDQSLTRNAQT